MSQLIQLASELQGWFPEISALARLPFVTRAYRDIRDSRKWSFLRKTGVLYCSGQIVAGTVMVTQFSASVVGDATAAAAWIAAALPSPPQVPLTQRQFRTLGNTIYDIIAFDGVNTLTLSRPYIEGTQVNTTYMVYQPYYAAPAQDFVKWLSIVDPVNDYRFRRKNLYCTQEEIDRRDPNRTSFSIPIKAASLDYVDDPAGTPGAPKRPRYEFWPHPIQQLGYNVEYQIRGDLTASTDTLPTSIPDELVIAGAKRYGAEYMASQPTVDARKAAVFLNLRNTAQAEYKDLLLVAQREDDNVFENMVFDSESEPVLSGPLDADYIQSHDIWWVQ